MRRCVVYILALMLLPLATRADINGNSSLRPRFSEALSDTQAPTGTPEGLKDVGVDEHLGGQLPLGTLFSDENGSIKPLGSFIQPGKPVVIQLGYLNCTMLCDEVSKGLVNGIRDVDLSVGPDYQILFISINPKEERTEALSKKKRFVQMYDRAGAADAWHYLVGDQKSIDAITQAIGFKYKWIDESKMFSHPAVLAVASPEGKITHYIYGLNFKPSELRQSVADASAGKTSESNYILLICSHVVSFVGRNTAAAMFVMRTGGVLTMAALFGFIVFRIRKEMRSAKQPGSDVKGPLAASH